MPDQVLCAYVLIYQRHFRGCVWLAVSLGLVNNVCVVHSVYTDTLVCMRMDCWCPDMTFSVSCFPWFLDLVVWSMSLLMLVDDC
jgi:hypothetical protein